MDGFMLPPFESTCILKDKDIICVKKKRGTLSNVIEGGDAANPVEELEFMEKQPVHTGLPLLANKEFEKEAGGYKSDTEEDEEDQPKDTSAVQNPSGSNAVSKKRKQSKKLQSPKKKKRRLLVPDGVENDLHTEHVESRKSLRKKEKGFDSQRKPCMNSTSEGAEKSDYIDETMPSVKR
ncbi:hypothetical protein LguiA_032800 [Lonicera macranthoides]